MTTFEDILQKDGVLVYTNVGVSMMPLLRQHRDLMIIHRYTGSPRLRRYDIPLFKRPDGKYILHRVLWVTTDGYWITGDNQWRLEFVREEQILGVLKAVQRDGRQIQTTDRSFRLYTHLWCDLYPIRACLFIARDAYYKLRRTLHRQN